MSLLLNIWFPQSQDTLASSRVDNLGSLGLGGWIQFQKEQCQSECRVIKSLGKLSVYFHLGTTSVLYVYLIFFRFG